MWSRFPSTIISLRIVIYVHHSQEPIRSYEAPRKRRKLEDLKVSEADWDAFEQDLQVFEIQHVQGKNKFAFAFVEGPLIKALRSGDW